jgi:hypothetical protein
MGMGGLHYILPTQTLPAAADPLEPGTYTVTVSGKRMTQNPDHGPGLWWRVMYDKPTMTTSKHDPPSPDSGTEVLWPAVSSEPITIKIKDDPQALAAAEKALMTRATRESFARYVARVYAIDPAVKACIDQFLNDDPNTTYGTLGTLTEVRRFPTGAEARLQRLAARHCHAEASDFNDFLLMEIALIAGNMGTNEAIEAALVIARSGAGADVRESAVFNLGMFPQKKAESELLALLAKKDSPVCWPAVCMLAHRRCPAAVAPLLQAVKDKEKCGVAVRLLGGFRDRPVARDALNAALKDHDPSIRGYAKAVLESEAEDWEDDFLR